MKFLVYIALFRGYVKQGPTLGILFTTKRITFEAHWSKNMKDNYKLDLQEVGNRYNHFNPTHHLVKASL